MLKKGQIWVETVIYTLIGLAILALVLGLVIPKVDELKDKAVIEQSLDMLNSIDQVIDNIKYVTGNSRPVEIKIQKGLLIISGEQDIIEYRLEESKYKYSQIGRELEVGRVKVLTQERAKSYDVSLKLNYSESVNITWKESDNLYTFQPSPQPFTIVLTNKRYIGDIPNIDFS